MSVCYWSIEGIGLNTDDIRPFLDAEKLAKFLFGQLPEDEELDAMIVAGDYSGFNVDDFLYGEPFENMADILCHADDTNSLTYGDDGEGTDYFYYPPSMPWARSAEEPGSQEAVILRIIEAVQKIATMSEDAIRKIIDCDLYIQCAG